MFRNNIFFRKVVTVEVFFILKYAGLNSSVVEYPLGEEKKLSLTVKAVGSNPTPTTLPIRN